METSSSHDLSFELFDDSSNDHSLIPGAVDLTHSTPIKNSLLSIPFEPKIFVTSDSEPNTEAFDVDTSFW